MISDQIQGGCYVVAVTLLGCTAVARHVCGLSWGWSLRIAGLIALGAAVLVAGILWGAGRLA